MRCFYFLVIMNKATTSCCVSVYFQIFLVCVPKSGILGSNDNSWFSILMNYQIVFPSNCIILCSQQLCTRVPIYTHALQHLLLSFIYYYIHPSVVCGKWYVIVMMIFTLYSAVATGLEKVSFHFNAKKKKKKKNNSQ